MFKTPGWLGYIRDEKLPSYIGIILSHYKDPYQPTSIMECQQGFECCSFGEYFYFFQPPNNANPSILEGIAEGFN